MQTMTLEPTVSLTPRLGLGRGLRSDVGGAADAHVAAHIALDPVMWEFSDVLAHAQLMCQPYVGWTYVAWHTNGQ